MSYIPAGSPTGGPLRAVVNGSADFTLLRFNLKYVSAPISSYGVLRQTANATNDFSHLQVPLKVRVINSVNEGPLSGHSAPVFDAINTRVTKTTVSIF